MSTPLVGAHCGLRLNQPWGRVPSSTAAGAAGEASIKVKVCAALWLESQICTGVVLAIEPPRRSSAMLGARAETMMQRVGNAVAVEPLPDSSSKEITIHFCDQLPLGAYCCTGVPAAELPHCTSSARPDATLIKVT